MKRKLSVAANFSRFPAGRFRADGPFSGEQFRDELLLPLLKSNETIELLLDGTLGYGSSFLEEAFGGLVRVHRVPLGRLKSSLKLISSDSNLVYEIWRYIDEAAQTASVAR